MLLSFPPSIRTELDLLCESEKQTFTNIFKEVWESNSIISDNLSKAPPKYTRGEVNNSISHRVIQIRFKSEKNVELVLKGNVYQGEFKSLPRKCDIVEKCADFDGKCQSVGNCDKILVFYERCGPAVNYHTPGITKECLEDYSQPKIIKDIDGEIAKNFASILNANRDAKSKTKNKYIETSTRYNVSVEVKSKMQGIGSLNLVIDNDKFQSSILNGLSKLKGDNLN